jgi:hypothetical protein
MSRLAVAVCALLTGCSSEVLRLEARWAPLVEVVERPALVLSDGASTTLGNRVYVVDLGRWERRYPEGSPEREALLLHEQEHARRQAAAGLGRWLVAYLDDPDVMWDEERRGWARELRHLQRSGRPVNPEKIATTLHEYRNLRGRMVSRPAALAFVLAVLAGVPDP